MRQKRFLSEERQPSAFRWRLGLEAMIGVIAATVLGYDQVPAPAVAYAATARSVFRPNQPIQPITTRPTPPASPCPDEMAPVGSACVDRYEAHLVLADSPDIVHSPYESLSPQEQYRARSTSGVVPQAYISRDEAASACNRAGKRLCTGREWRKACKGTASSLHPYGPKEIRGRCNSGKSHLPTVLFGMNSTVVNGESNYNSPRLNQEP